MHLVGMREQEKANGRKEPTGPVLELSRGASGARALGEMRGEGKIQQGIIIKGHFAVPEWTGLLACRRNGPPLLAFLTAPRDFIG